MNTENRNDLGLRDAGAGCACCAIASTPETVGEVTAAVTSEANAALRFYLNADGLGDEAALKIELLGEDEKPLPGYSGRDTAVVRQSGFHTPIAWGGKSEARDLPGQFRLRVTFEGARKTDIRFSALYVASDP